MVHTARPATRTFDAVALPPEPESEGSVDFANHSDGDDPPGDDPPGDDPARDDPTAEAEGGEGGGAPAEEEQPRSRNSLLGSLFSAVRTGVRTGARLFGGSAGSAPAPADDDDADGSPAGALDIMLTQAPAANTVPMSPGRVDPATPSQQRSTPRARKPARRSDDEEDDEVAEGEELINWDRDDDPETRFHVERSVTLKLGAATQPLPDTFAALMAEAEEEMVDEEPASQAEIRSQPRTSPAKPAAADEEEAQGSEDGEEPEPRRSPRRAPQPGPSPKPRARSLSLSPARGRSTSPAGPASQPVGKPKRGPGRPRKRRGRQTRAQQQAEEDEGEEADAEDAQPRGSRGKARVPEVVVEEAEDEGEEEEDGPPVTRSRAQTQEVEESVEPEDEPPVTRSRARSQQVEESVEPEDELPVPRSRARSQQTRDSAAPEDEEPAPRAKRRSQPQEQQDSEEPAEEDKPRVRRRGRASQLSESESDEDEPDVRRSLRNRKQQSDSEEEPTPRRSLRSSEPAGSQSQRRSPRKSPAVDEVPETEDSETGVEDDGPAKRTRSAGKSQEEELPPRRRGRPKSEPIPAKEKEDGRRRSAPAKGAGSESEEEGEEAEAEQDTPARHTRSHDRSQAPRELRPPPESDEEEQGQESPAKHTRSHDKAKAAEQEEEASEELEAHTRSHDKAKAAEQEEEASEELEAHTAPLAPPGASQAVASQRQARAPVTQTPVEMAGDQAADSDEAPDRPLKLFEDEEGNPLRFFLINGAGRAEALSAIRAHGGQSVMSESVADFRLAPPRFINTTPRDAISFEWVHACVREGVRVATEDHLIRGSRNKVSGSNRTPFTRDDDVLLIDLAMKGKLGEGKKAGNKAFQDLAEKYPHHSAQAWRERWVKHLQPEVGRQLEKERREAKDRERAERAAQGEGLDAEEEPEGQDDADGEEEEVPRRRLPQTVRQQGDRRTRQPFTEEDDDILIERCNVPGKRDTKGNEIFKAIEAEYPHHTYQSWRNRWVKTIIPRLEAKGELLIYDSRKRSASDGEGSAREEESPRPVRRKRQRTATAPREEPEDIDEDDSDAEMRKALDAQARIGDAAERRRRESARPAAPANPPAASSSAAPAPRTPRDASAAPQDTGANEDVDMAEAGEPADTAFDWDYAILSEDEVEPGEWNDVAEEVDLVETTALIKNTTPKRASDAGTRPRSTGKPPVAPAATSTGGRSGLAGIASSLARPANVRGSSQLSQRRGNENAASRANSDRAASKVPADARELLALATTAEDRRQILTALNMASGVVGIAFQLHKVKNDVSKLAAAVRRLVFTEEEDNLIEHYRDEAELMDLADRHGADLVNKRWNYLAKTRERRQSLTQSQAR